MLEGRAEELKEIRTHLTDRTGVSSGFGPDVDDSEAIGRQSCRLSGSLSRRTVSLGIDKPGDEPCGVLVVSTTMRSASDMGEVSGERCRQLKRLPRSRQYQVRAWRWRQR